MRRLIGTLLVAGVMVVGAAPAVATPGTLSDAACFGQDVKATVIELGGEELKAFVDRFPMDDFENVGDVHKFVRGVCATS